MQILLCYNILYIFDSVFSIEYELNSFYVPRVCFLIWSVICFCKFTPNNMIIYAFILIINLPICYLNYSHRRILVIENMCISSNN